MPARGGEARGPRLWAVLMTRSGPARGPTRCVSSAHSGTAPAALSAAAALALRARATALPAEAPTALAARRSRGSRTVRLPVTMRGMTLAVLRRRRPRSVAGCAFLLLSLSLLRTLSLPLLRTTRAATATAVAVAGAPIPMHLARRAPIGLRGHVQNRKGRYGSGIDRTLQEPLDVAQQWLLVR